MTVRTPGSRPPTPRRPWGLIAVLVAFFAAVMTVIGIGTVSLSLNPLLQ